MAGVLRGVKSEASIWRMLVWERLGSFAPTTVTAMAVRNRLLRQGTMGLQQLFAQLWALLRVRPRASALSLAPFGRSVVALDETTLERVRRLTADLREEAADSELLQVGGTFWTL